MNQVLVGLGTCGIAAGAEATYRALEARLASSSIPWRLSKTGCLGMCFREPMVEVRLEDGARFAYGGITPERVDRILDEHLGAARPIEEWLVWTNNGKGEEKGRYIISKGGLRDGELLWGEVDNEGSPFVQKLVTRSMAAQIKQNGSVIFEEYPWMNKAAGDKEPKMRLSAWVLKRGPSMTRKVPPRCTGRVPAAATAS